MPTDHTNFPTLLSREDAKKAATAERWHRVAAALHLIDDAGYTEHAERLLDHDANARDCRAALVGALHVGLDERDRAEAGRVLDIAIKGLVKSQNDPNAQRRIANLLTHGSPAGPVT